MGAGHPVAGDPGRAETAWSTVGPVRALGTALALAACASGCDCGGGGSPSAFWVGQRDLSSILLVSSSGEVSLAAEAPAVAAPVRALLAQADGTIVVLEDVQGGAPPVLRLARSGERLAAFAAQDGSGTPLFDPAEPPWAVAEDANGTLWVTGRRAPARYAGDGTFLGRAAESPLPTRGIAALPDGRMVVTYGVQEVAVYAPDGSVAATFSPAFGPAETYYGIDALAARPDGTLLVGVLRHGAATEGIVVEARLGEGVLVATRDPALAARLVWIPSALALDGDRVVVGPSLAPLAPPTCASFLSGDLTTDEGCVAAGDHRGVAVVR